MLVSLNELKKYVDISNLTAEEIANGLTFAGVEVEEVSSFASGTNLVIGEILECEKHPDSDHLHILKVNLGQKFGVEQIVCGAPNARTGLKVIVARVGSKLPDGEIKKGVIRGVESNGMCCSLLELGVDSKYLTEQQTKGIEELDSNAPVGEENVLGYLNLDDTVLNLKVLANRPDLLSLYNVAKEVGAIFDRKVSIPSKEIPSSFTTKVVNKSETDRCSQFAIREVRNIKIKSSPKWLSSVLSSSGIRSINNVVDIGNYVMLLTGQPLHMYDLDKLPKNELCAKDDFVGEFVALDDKSYSVIKNDIVISSNNIPMCLGGVMGSKASEVDANTKNVVIESASFDGASIRHTSNRLGLASESSQRFVKGTNKYQSNDVLNLATQLLIEIADAKEISDIKNWEKSIYNQQVVSSSYEKINDRLGTAFTNEQIKNVLTRLNFEVEEKGDKIDVLVPKYRLDIDGSADLSEEVIRLLGYENVHSVLPRLDTKVGALTISQTRKRIVQNLLLDNGLDECVTYSLISKKEADKFNLLNNEDKYQILNPLTDDHEIFRTHILHSLLKVASYNVNRQNKNLALFEISNMMSKQSRSNHLAIVLLGKDGNRDLLETIPYDFYHMKGLVESIFNSIGIENSRYKFSRISNCNKELHPGKSAEIVFQNQVIGKFGEVHPSIYNEYDLGKTNCVVLEMNLDPIFDAKVSVNKMNPISKFPTVERDLAVILDKNVLSSDLIKAIKVSSKGLAKDAKVFDVYSGNNISENKKSIAIKITFGNDEKTLVDKEINDAMDNIKFDLAKLFKAELRS